MKSEIAQLQEALDAAPDHWDTRRHLAEHLYNEGDYEHAARVIAEAPGLPADEAEQIYAAQLIAPADPQRSHEILDAVIESNPASAHAHETKANLFDAHDLTEDAERHRAAAAALGHNDDAEAEEGVIVIGADDIEDADVAPAIAVGDDPKKAEEEDPVPAIPKPLAPPPKKPKPDAPAPAHAAPTAAAAVPAPSVPKPTAAAVPPPETGEATHEEKDHGSGVAPPPPIAAASIEPESDPLTSAGYLSASQLHELEDEEERIARRDQNKSKLSSLLISIAVHVGILLVLGIIIIARPLQPAPEIVAIAAPPAVADPDLSKKKVRPTYSTQTKPSSKVVQVLSATAYSEVAVPAIDDPPPDIIVPGLSMEEGFGSGISFAGAGDGWVSTLPAAIQSRCSLVERMSRLKVGGGNRKCEDAVRRSLVWLHENQNDDGSWGRAFPVAMTGLALLSFLGHCETPDSPEFAENVIGAATYLMDTAMKSEGKMVSAGGKISYEHAIATYALSELFTLSRRGKRKIPDLTNILRQCVPVIIKGQNPNGSWNYSYKGPRSDTSVSGWNMQALQAARHTEIDFPGLTEAFNKGMDYMVSMQGPKGGFGYSDAPDDKISLAGVGVLALQFGERGDSDEVKKGLDYILTTRKSLSYGSINFYEWYYSTQACFQASGKTWDAWNDMFLEPLLEAQDKSGYWPPERSDQTDKQAKGDGDVYRTCLATLMLEVYYRYLPTGEKIKK